MANTTIKGANTINIVLDGATDWSFITDGGFKSEYGIKIASITFNASAANDVLIIRDRTVGTGVITHKFGPANAAELNLIRYNIPPVIEFPVIDATDLVLSVPANASVIIRCI